MLSNIRVRALTAAGVLVAGALLAYSNTAAVTAAAPVPGEHGQLTRAQTHKKTWQSCKKNQGKKQRKPCQGKPTGPITTTGTATATGTTTGGTATTTGTTPFTEAEKQAELQEAQTVSNKPDPEQIAVGKVLFETLGCSHCHGLHGEGAEGDGFEPYDVLPRAQSVTGVIEQLVEPAGGAPQFHIAFELMEHVGDYVCSELTKDYEFAPTAKPGEKAQVVEVPAC